jgi:hypothetical protein
LTYTLVHTEVYLFGTVAIVSEIETRWASEDVGSSILIGPSENAKTNLKIFGAWFDEGRITEMADSTTIWRTLGSNPCFFKIFITDISCCVKLLL